MKIERFEDLVCWKKAREAVKRLYALTNKPDFKRDRSLCDQIRRAAISIMSNIAEGFGRFNPKEFAQFLNIARGSVAEVRSQLYISFDQNYISEDDFSSTGVLLTDCEKTCAGFFRYLRGIK